MTSTALVREVKALEAITEQINKLDALADTMRSQGISSSLALEADAMLPSSNVLSAYYSGAASAEKAKVALESLSAGVWAMIAAGVAALIALVVKAIDWFGGGSSGGGGGSSGGATSFTPAAVEQRQEDTAQVVESVTEVMQIARHEAAPEVIRVVDKAVQNATTNHAVPSHQAPPPPSHTTKLTDEQAEKKGQADLERKMLEILRTMPLHGLDAMCFEKYTETLGQMCDVLLHQRPEDVFENFLTASDRWYQKKMAEVAKIDSGEDKRYVDDLNGFKFDLLKNYSDEVETIGDELGAASALHHALPSKKPEDYDLHAVGDPLLMMKNTEKSLKLIQAPAVAARKEEYLKSLQSVEPKLKSVREHYTRIEQDSPSDYAAAVAKVIYGQTTTMTNRIKTVHLVFDTVERYYKDVCKTQIRLARFMHDLIETLEELDTMRENPSLEKSPGWLKAKKEMIEYIKEYKAA